MWHEICRFFCRFGLKKGVKLGKTRLVPDLVTVTKIDFRKFSDH